MDIWTKWFPELRNFEGRFYELFKNGLYKCDRFDDIPGKIKKWVKWAKKELGNKKCYDRYRDPICVNCQNREKYFCTKYPQLGQTWADDKPNRPADLRHPNTREWYWCISECPDFKPLPPPKTVGTVKEYTKDNYLRPAGAVNCPYCFEELHYVNVETDNPFDTINAFCKKCKQPLKIRVWQTEELIEIWNPENTEK